MIRSTLSKHLSDKTKLSIKAKYGKIKTHLVQHLRSYTADDLKSKLRQIGIAETDTLLVHANFEQDSGFKGSPQDVVNALIQTVGLKGNLLMVSIPYRGTAYDYLKKNKPFRIRKTMSMMGLVTELFRRTEGVMRSLHPTHPVLVYGKDSSWLVEGHEKCMFPCGAGSPFDKFRQLKGKILFFDVDFTAITFFHYIEDHIKHKLPFNIYHNEIFSVTAYDYENREHIIKTHVFNPQVIRNAAKLKQEMVTNNMIKKARVGNSQLLLVEPEEVVSCMTSMVEAENYPYDI
jgi:aminoglycoside N3'-acetyltransferase